eukprot:g6254.t1
MMPLIKLSKSNATSLFLSVTGATIAFRYYRRCTSSNNKMNASGLVSCEWLNHQIEKGSENLVILDATWLMPSDKRDAKEMFSLGPRIPGAKFFDVDAVADLESSFSHMMPDEETFAKYAFSIGLQPHQKVVIYDAVGIFSSPRAWYTLRVFGFPADRVAVLDGGLPAWLKSGFKTEKGVRNADSNFELPFVKHKWLKNSNLIWSKADVLNNITTASNQLVDARSKGRFNGTLSEPRPGMRSGHIPNSFNVCFDSLLESGFMKSSDAIRKEFTEAGIDLQKPITVSCGSGMTACILALGLQVANYTNNVCLYDASWVEWGKTSNSNNLPVVKKKKKK